MATLLCANGQTREIPPGNGKDFTLGELQGFVGGDIEAVASPDGRTMFVDEHGKHNNKPRNEAATVWMRPWILADDYIAGDAILCTRKEIGEGTADNDVLEILQLLVARFRWRHQGYDKLVCPSCGALATCDDEDSTIRRIDKCSPSCPWRRAEEAVQGS